ncbi:SbcC/MukB-like Walker B domain-containing protein, partial [Paenibacillus filicis]
AAELAAELATARERLAALAAEAGRAGAALEAQRAEEARERELREKAQQRQAQLKAELARVETPAAARRRLQDALQAARELERTEALAAERQADADRQRQEAARESRLLQEQAVQERVWDDRAAAWMATAAAMRRSADAVEARLQELEQAEAREAELRRRSELAAERQAMAGVLAAQLKDGELCPVCGSAEHPALAGHRHEDAGQAAASLADEATEPVTRADHDEAAAGGGIGITAEVRAVTEDGLEGSRQQMREERFAVRRLLQRLDSLERQYTSTFGQAVDGSGLSELREAAQQAAAGQELLADRLVGQGTDGLDGLSGDRHPHSLAAHQGGNHGSSEDASQAGASLLSGQLDSGSYRAFLNTFEASPLAEHLSPEFAGALTAAVELCSEGLRRLERSADSLEQGWQELQQQVRQGERKRQELETRLHSLQLSIEAEDRKAGEWKQALAAQHAVWQQTFGEWEPAQVPELAEQGRRQEEAAEDIRQRLEKSVSFLQDKDTRLQQLQQEQSGLEKQSVRLSAEQETLEGQIRQQAERLLGLVGEQEPGRLAAEANAELQRLREDAGSASKRRELAVAAAQTTAAQAAAATQAEQSAHALETATEAEWQEQAAEAGFASAADVEEALVSEEQRSAWQQAVEAHGKQEHQVAARLRELEATLAGRQVSDEEWEQTEQELAACKQRDEEALQHGARSERDCEELRRKHDRWQELDRQRSGLQQELTLLGKLQSVLRGNAFVEFLAEEQLMHVSRAASERLGQLTRRKYAIEVDSGGGFVIRDDANGGTRRPVTTLSGGETFLTSLSLALALSTQIQLKGEYPLEFFFLDEGFGTLDPELLDAVVTALEKLHMDKLTVGVISHVPELRARLPRRLVVHPAEPGGRGSRVELETM